VLPFTYLIYQSEKELSAKFKVQDGLRSQTVCCFV
jgi:hypothetical protein